MKEIWNDDFFIGILSFQFYGNYANIEFKHSSNNDKAIIKLNDTYFESLRIIPRR